MKRIIVITLVLIMLAASVVPALAAGGPPTNRGTANGNCYSTQGSYANPSGYASQSGYGIRMPYALSGTITAVDAVNHTVSVKIACGNRLANPYIGQVITLSTNDSTRYLLRNDDGTVTPISFTDLAEGEAISSHGSLVDGVWTASRITAGALLTCLP